MNDEEPTLPTRSQPRVCMEADKRDFDGQRIQPGWSLDLTTNDPKTGQPWDLADKGVQSRVKKLVRSTQPYCIIGSPPCAPFSRLQEISRAKRNPKTMAEELRKGKEHIRFGVEVYRMQIAQKRHFIHEHPATATSWQMEEIKELLMEPMVDAEVIHMCAYGMKPEDESGPGLVKKPTRIMSSAPEVLKRIRARCSNEGGGEQHRHVPLLQGRARAAQVYPRGLCVRICEGSCTEKTGWARNGSQTYHDIVGDAISDEDA